MDCRSGASLDSAYTITFSTSAKPHIKSSRATSVSDTFEWDVFLSHSSVDKPRVARLAKRLEATGLKVWFDREDIDDGQDIVAAIEDGLQRSRVLILCMTKSALESEWVRIERNTATFRDPANAERRFLPLLFEDCTVPAMLRRIKYNDWRSESDDARPPRIGEAHCCL